MKINIECEEVSEKKSLHYQLSQRSVETHVLRHNITVEQFRLNSGFVSHVSLFVLYAKEFITPLVTG